MNALDRHPRGLARSASRLAATVSSAWTARRAREHLERLTERERASVRARLLGELSTALVEAHGIRVLRHGRLPVGPALIAANHLSYLDPLLVAHLTPCVPVAKREAAGWPILGEAMRALGVLFVDRHAPASGAAVIRQARRLLVAGTSVLGFPEGTTSRGRGVLPFHRGLFVAARAAGVPVLPLALRYESCELCWVDDDPFLPHYLRTAARPGTVATVRVGPPLDALAFPDARSLALATRAVIAALLYERSEVRA